MYLGRQKRKQRRALHPDLLSQEPQDRTPEEYTVPETILEPCTGEWWRGLGLPRDVTTAPGPIVHNVDGSFSCTLYCHSLKDHKLQIFCETLDQAKKEIIKVINRLRSDDGKRSV